LVSLCTINRLRNVFLFHWWVEPNHEPDVTAFTVGASDPFRFVDQGLDEEHTHAAGILFAMDLLVDVGLVGHGLHAFAVVDDFDLEGTIAGREYYAYGQAFVHSIAVFHGIDAGLGDSGLENPINLATAAAVLMATFS
jgi:hypothetical protein